MGVGYFCRRPAVVAVRNRILRYVKQAGRPEGLVELPALKVWIKPMTDRGI